MEVRSSSFTATSGLARRPRATGIDSLTPYRRYANNRHVELVDERTPTARERMWPQGVPLRFVTVASVLASIAYVVATFIVRLPAIFDRWAADGDQAQAVWHYWRYHIDGAIPAGDLLTDYAFVMHAPPMWWALMAGLSHIFEPLMSAKILHVVAYFLTPAVAWLLVARRSAHVLGAAAAFLVVRSVDYHLIIAGGYARSFGPFLTLLFLWLFLERKHVATLAVLVLQAAFYPSVVIPCGIAYGTYTVVAGPMAERKKRMLGMFVAGLLIIGLGKSQDLRAPEWWGHLVSEAEALEMPAWGPGGRISEAPLRPVRLEVSRNLLRAFQTSGEPWLPQAGTAFARHPAMVSGAVIAALAVAGILGHRRSRKRNESVDPLPWETLLLAASAFIAYFLARQMAFKLYLPYRALQHVLPYVIDVGIPLWLWAVVVRWFPRRRGFAAIGLSAFIIVSATSLWGDGLVIGGRTYLSFKHNRKLYTFLRTLPNDVVLGGDFTHTATIPLFGAHQVYINKNLTHPFRRGYYAECERRILRMYQALYASSLEEVVAFGREEDVQYLVYRPKHFFQQKDQRLFQPVRRELDRLWEERRASGGFALANPPASAVVFRDGDQVVVKIEALVGTPPGESVLPAAQPASPPAQQTR